MKQYLKVFGILGVPYVPKHGIIVEVSGSIPLSYVGGKVLEYQVPPHGRAAFGFDQDLEPVLLKL